MDLGYNRVSYIFKAKEINEKFSDLIDKSEPLFFYRLNWNPMD